MLEIIANTAGNIQNRSVPPRSLAAPILLSLFVHCLGFYSLEKAASSASFIRKTTKPELQARLADRGAHSGSRASIARNSSPPSVSAVNESVEAIHPSELAPPQRPIALGDGDLDAPLQLLDDHAVANLNLPANLFGDADISLLIDPEGVVKWAEVDRANLPNDIVQQLRMELPSLRFSKPMSKGVSTTVFIKLKLAISEHGLNDP